MGTDNTPRYSTSSKGDRTMIKECPKCGSLQGKQIWDTSYGLERQTYYECYSCGYKEEPISDIRKEKEQ